MHIFKKSKIEKTKKLEKSMKNRMFFGTSILDGFRRVLGWFWEAQNLDFRILFGDLAISISKLVLKGFEIASKMQLSSLTLGV